MNNWSELAETFHRTGAVWFASGLAMDVRMPIEWPSPFPQICKTRLARDLCYFMEAMKLGGYGFRPLQTVPANERNAGEAFCAEALTQYAIGEMESLAPSMQTDWTFGVILIGATQFLAKVESEARLAIARVDPDSRTPPEVLDLLAEFIAIDREQYETEARRLTALAAQGDKMPPSVQ